MEPKIWSRPKYEHSLTFESVVLMSGEDPIPEPRPQDQIMHDMERRFVERNRKTIGQITIGETVIKVDRP